MNRQQQPVHYIHRINYTAQERLVGVFVLSALAVIVVLMFINSKTAHIFEDKITLNTYLTKAEGISTETKVKISGIEVGKVTGLDISPDHRIHVKLIVYKRYQSLLRSDSRGSLGKLSVLGNSVIDITAGSTDQPMLADGATLAIEEPLSVDELLAQLTPVVKNIESSVQRFSAIMQQIEPQQVANIASNLDASASNIRDLTAKLNSNNGTLGMVINEPAFQQQFSNTIVSIDHAFKQMDKRLQELESTSVNASKASSDFPVIAAEFKQMLNNTNTMMTTLNIELKQLPDLVTRMNVLMEETDRLMQGINNSWLFSSEEGRLQRKLIGVQPYHD